MNGLKKNKKRVKQLMSIDIELQIASHAKTLPHPAQIREWVSLVLYHRVTTAELTIRIVDEPEMAELNWQYRTKEGPTNVLSFSYESLPISARYLLGDIVICASVVAEEAEKYNKPLLSHWAHMVIHGVLHLLGFDHDVSEKAVEMESIETELLIKLGFPSPYGEITAP